MYFANRIEAGNALGKALHSHAGNLDAVVVALPRGGVVVAAAVAETLGAPLDVLVVRKLGVPGHEELAAGAIAEGGARVLNRHVMNSLNLSESSLERVEHRELQLVKERAARYREAAEPIPIRNKTVFLVDDGLATGATVRVAIQSLRNREPAAVIVAVPVAPRDAVDALRHEAEDVICLHTPADFGGVGRWYEDFPQVEDEKVMDILRRRRSAAA